MQRARRLQDAQPPIDLHQQQGAGLGGETVATEGRKDRLVGDR